MLDSTVEWKELVKNWPNKQHSRSLFIQIKKLHRIVNSQDQPSQLGCLHSCSRRYPGRAPGERMHAPGWIEATTTEWCPLELCNPVAQGWGLCRSYWNRIPTIKTIVFFRKSISVRRTHTDYKTHTGDCLLGVWSHQPTCSDEKMKVTCV